MAVLKILKTGKDNIDSTDISDFAFHSEYPTFKIALSGSHTFTIQAGQSYGEYTIPHALDYMPLYFANVKYAARSYNVTSVVTPFDETTYYIFLPNQSGWDSIINFYSSVDGDNLVIGASTGDGENLVSTATFTAYWLIMLDEF